jgi:2-polyprenyl-3-methyl-5-hydroxy-6-metoxy-1,4-benzoquinol methylase
LFSRVQTFLWILLPARLGRMGGRMAQDQLSQTYDDWHGRIAKTEGDLGAISAPWHVTVSRLLPDLNGLRVLEIGCGRGDFAIWMANRYPRATVVAIDFSKTAIDEARDRALRRNSPVEFAVGDATHLAFADGTFDMIVSCECLEHVPEPERMAAEIRRLLKHGGRFILTTENYFNGTLLAWLKAWLTGSPFNSGSGVQPHENFFLFWRVKRLLTEGGLVVAHVESNHYQWLLLPGVDPGKLATTDVNNALLKRLLRPFGRHFTYAGAIAR